MRGSLGWIIVAVAGGALAGCSSSPTSASQCDSRITTASYANEQFMLGTVTAIAFASDSSATGDVETVHALIHAVDGSAAFTVGFVVNSTTAVFERTGSAPPQASSACQLARGDQVELPFALITDGFGDFLSDSVPLPSATQIVILH